MSSRPDSKTASHFVSFTLKLKDKLHPQWIRRSEPIKHVSPPRLKALDLNQSESAGVLVDRQRAVVSSLQYFKALVDRLGLDRLKVDGLGLNQSVLGGLLGGASSRVLEAVQTLVQLDPHLSSSETVSSCLTRLYQSVAQLIRWADQVMLRGIAHDNESAPSVTMVIRVVLDSVKELVKLAAERQDGSTPLSPVQSQLAVGKSGASEEQETTSTCQSPGAPAEEQQQESQEEQQALSAPPKPPMPSLELRPPEPHPHSRR